MMARLESMAGGQSASPGFPLALRDEFLSRARPFHARKGQIVIAEGTQSTDVYVIRSGKVQVSLFSEQGRETILRELGKDQIFGELAAIDLEPRSANIIALEDTAMAIVSGDEFLTFLAEVPAAGLWMAQLFATRVRNLTEKTFELATMSVSNRLQSELLRHCIVSGIAEDRSVIQRLPTHADLAARIGSHREAITRELGLLASEGIVSQAGRKLTILSVSRLQALLHRTLR
jgi:CRP/FNR family transcriptional regulator, cyclic AMP receptor protein